MRTMLKQLIYYLLAVVLVACTQKPALSPEPVDPGWVINPSASPTWIDISSLTASRYPSVDGSTSTYPLQITIACAILNVECVWTEGDFLDLTRRIAPVDNLLATDEHEAIFSLYHNGTHGSYMNLVDGEANLILVAREPSEAEHHAAQSGRSPPN